jgi:hypothetical protein
MSANSSGLVQAKEKQNNTLTTFTNAFDLLFVELTRVYFRWTEDDGQTLMVENNGEIYVVSNLTQRIVIGTSSIPVDSFTQWFGVMWYFYRRS